MSDKYIPPFPLKWPPGLPRNKTHEAAKFRTGREAAMTNVEKELGRLAQDSGIRVANIYITSNVAGIRAAEPADPGVAVWFDWDGVQHCVAVDLYTKVESNLQACFRMIEADRTKIRHGGLQMLRAAMHGARLMLEKPDGKLRLDAPGAKRPWRVVLRFQSGVQGPAETMHNLDAAYKHLAREYAGDAAKMQELNVARDEARAELDEKTPSRG